LHFRSSSSSSGRPTVFEFLEVTTVGLNNYDLRFDGLNFLIQFTGCALLPFFTIKGLQAAQMRLTVFACLKILLLVFIIKKFSESLNV